jgi:hypothetical protein
MMLQRSVERLPALLLVRNDFEPMLRLRTGTLCTLTLYVLPRPPHCVSHTLLRAHGVANYGGLLTVECRFGLQAALPIHARRHSGEA